MKTPHQKAAFTRKYKKLVKSDEYKAANYELYSAQQSLAYDAGDQKRTTRLEAAQKAMSELKIKALA